MNIVLTVTLHSQFAMGKIISLKCFHWEKVPIWESREGDAWQFSSYCSHVLSIRLRPENKLPDTFAMEKMEMVVLTFTMAHFQFGQQPSRVS